MRPEISLPLLLILGLSLSSSLFWPASSLCTPRTSPHTIPIAHPSSPPSSAPKPSPSQKFSLPPSSSPSVSPPPQIYNPPEVSPPSSSPPAVSSSPTGSPNATCLDSSVRATCNHTEHPDLCFTSVQPFLPQLPTGPLNATALLSLTLKAVSAQTKIAREAAANLIAEPTTSTIAKGPLNDCLDMYDDVDFSITNTLKALASHDKGTVGSMLSAIVTDFDTCEEGFQELEVEPLMGKYDDTLHNLGSICLDLATSASLM